MKKTGIINQPISTVISGLGHTDSLVIADAGLPIPDGVTRIDLALKEGVPSFLVTLEVILSEMQVEKAIIALEIKEKNPTIEKRIIELLGHVPVEYISHENFKLETNTAKAIIRTGEFSPYANIILLSGVVF
ncbi:MAG: D-ribose pyranase [Anaerolineae bacterium]|jgi:D-ribose pyranase|nr:D-ribose pyranase [Anaerolineae bacterium]MBT7016340.1 D-ribose pyranase [Anaerolineae bacterium]